MRVIDRGNDTLIKKKKTKEEMKRLEGEGEVKGEGRSQMRNKGNR